MGNYNRTPINCTNDGIVLYYHPNSFYSQKILFALYEKNIKFSAYEVDVTNGEQYSQWFLELNPKGEVPVLQDGTLIIPESGRIISYIEDHFQGENIPSLLPKDLDRSVTEKIVGFHKKISRIPIGAISMGSFIHTDLCSNPKPPFIGITRNSFLQNDSKISSVLEQYAKVNPIHAENLRRKAQFQEKKRAIITNRNEFMILIKAVDTVLSEIESELEKNESTNEWLCSDQITIADISLGVLLQRLYSLGFENYFWISKRPHLKRYFSKISTRESLKKSLPTTFSTVRAVWTNTPWMYKAGVAALSATIVISGIIGRT
ncbi:Ganglioside-induced differentiation-associated protein 1 [Pseudolycoriella hygida]|uniref:Ganglioside-induced differentiation-associated protein 1 n=1 Tax=Pseudolycoriella hygida TaxID=35572 RepID=A0A9Q0S3C2_9DIPT|nr:Ganglioside-induced differentiation-associated protein 1 [Pseudolycoriella hygida]